MTTRTLIAVGVAAVLTALSPAAAVAGPTSPPDYGKYNPTDLPNQPPETWGVEKVIPSPSAPGGAVRIITDPLVGVSPAAGWVTFWCQSQLGFQYNIGATKLTRLAKYKVAAQGVRLPIVPPDTPGAIEIEPGLWVLPSGFAPVSLDLGSFKTDRRGSGGVKGISPLPAGYVYDVAVIISNASGTPVLWSPFDDTNGFIVY